MTDRRQRQKEQRAQKREQEKKKDRRRELRRRLTTGITLALVVIGVLWLLNTDFSGSDLPAGYQDFRNQTTACGGTQPPALTPMTFPDGPETQTDITASSRVTATMVTSCGTIEIELDPVGFPATVNSFVFLAREGFFDGQVFHRIVENFMAQGGDPQADGTGNPGYVIPDERPGSDFTYDRGVVAMANRGSRSTGSQFFIVIGENGRFLTPSFNVLGRVVSGDDVLDRIEAVPTRQPPGSTERSLPVETVYIESVTIQVSGN